MFTIRSRRKSPSDAALPYGRRIPPVWFTLRRRLASAGGFSLAETLLCCMILALSTATLASVMRLAGEQFNTRTRESDARILCNTLSQAVQDYLSCATSWDADSKSFETGAIPSLSVPARCSFTPANAAPGFLALEYTTTAGVSGTLPLAPSPDYVMRNGYPELTASCQVEYLPNRGFFSVTIRVEPLVPQRDTSMQEVQNEFIVIPIPSPEELLADGS